MTDQITLPLHLGGLGLSRIGPIEGSAAFLAAVAPTQLVMRSRAKAFLPFDGPSSKKLHP
jgi:hypothetical protein